METSSDIEAMLADFGRELEAMYRESGTPLEPGAGALLMRRMLEQLGGPAGKPELLVELMARAHGAAPGSMVDPAFRAELEAQLAALRPREPE